MAKLFFNSYVEFWFTLKKDNIEKQNKKVSRNLNSGVENVASLTTGVNVVVFVSIFSPHVINLVHYCA